MSKPKPVIVTITKSRHKTQRYSFTVDMPGKNPNAKNSERYTRPHSAKVGALRMLDARTKPHGYRGREWGFMGDCAWHWLNPKTETLHPIEFRKSTTK